MTDIDDSLKFQFDALFSTPSVISDSSGFQLFQPDPKPNFIPTDFPPIPNNLVFGKKMERLFSHYISQSTRYSILAENLQLIENKQTIGELDFLIKDNELQQVIHLEIACKFYIYRPGLSPNKMGGWIGPNKKDKLIDKLAKLKERQFPLLNHPVAHRKLQEFKISSDSIRQQLFLPGILFTPKNFNDDVGHVNPKAIQGFWLTKEQFHKDDFRNCQLAIPEKENWMVDPSHNSDWLPLEKIRKLVAEKHQNQRSPMVWRKTSSDEFERFFVLWW